MMKSNDSRKKQAGGFSLIELMFAIAVLAIAIIGSLAMVVIGIGRNGSTRMDTTATNVAQTVLEDIATALPNGTAVINITDCANNNLQITTAAGGAAQLPNGDIDFSGAAAPGYSGTYTICSGQANTFSATYDVRWRIDAVPGSPFAKLVTVAARQPFVATQGKFNYIPPVTLRTMVGM
jgi:prepilin-type N-terminal cleavage/methylation domain-containing protein